MQGTTTLSGWCIHHPTGGSKRIRSRVHQEREHSSPYYCQSYGYMSAYPLCVNNVPTTTVSRGLQDVRASHVSPWVFNPRPAKLYYAACGHICILCIYYNKTGHVRIT